MTETTYHRITREMLDWFDRELLRVTHADYMRRWRADALNEAAVNTAVAILTPISELRDRPVSGDLIARYTRPKPGRGKHVINAYDLTRTGILAREKKT